MPLIESQINTYQRSDIDGYEILEALALDLRWSWNRAAEQVWRQLDQELWDRTSNPWSVLQTVSKERLESALANPDFRNLVQELLAGNIAECDSPGWFQKNHAEAKLSCVAYFSMEFMLCEALPIYSGGLGNVAGDQLKAASDLGVPVVAVGLLYQRGYFRQMIDQDGAQEALYPYNDPGQLPITPLRKKNGEWLRLEVAFPGWSLWFRAWQVQVGRVRLLLLDSNDIANIPAYRGITSELYGGGPDTRLKQEILLGIGGWRLLKELGLTPEVCHLNEGHAALAVLERAADFMERNSCSFQEALTATRAGNLFTTHTAVSAGFDRFTPDLMAQYLLHYVENKLKISMEDFLSLGRAQPQDSGELFNMAYLALHGSGAVNGVSRLHGEVSRDLFASLFPRWPKSEIPIGHVTNGVHMPSWDSAISDGLWTRSCGRQRWFGACDKLEAQIRSVPDQDLWKMRNDGRCALTEFSRKRLSMQLAARGAPSEWIEKAKQVFDPDTLTLGFARRFATYKRPNILLHDPERLLRILKNPERPVQLVIAGKAHPADKPGQALIQEWIRFIRRPDVFGHIIFLADYDVSLTQHLVQGVDVWINTPRRPWEACGTSGMKVLANGGINLSELDGWWAEAYTPEIGWALGDGQEHHDDEAVRDAVEAEALYSLLENEVVPCYYNRNAERLPTEWIKRMRESMARLTPVYSANRAVREYTETYYLPAAAEYLKRAENKGALARELVQWENRLEKNWPMIHFGEVKIETREGNHFFDVQAYLAELTPAEVRVELFADGIAPELHLCVPVLNVIDNLQTYLFRCVIPAKRAAEQYTLRVIPQRSHANIPLEAAHILWQK